MTVPRMFASIPKESWPLGWEELEYYSKELRNYSLEHYIVAERSVFGLEEYRFAICKLNKYGSQREVLGTYTDMAEMIGMVRLLIGMAKDKRSEEDALVDGGLKAIYKSARS